VSAGAVHVPERVVAVDASGGVRTAAGRETAFDLIVGADGAGSLVRRTFLSPTPPSRLTMAAGWFAPGTSEMVVRFTPGLAGYLWLFPRLDHVGVGICAPLASAPTPVMVERLRLEVARSFPALLDADARIYAHTIPSPSKDPRTILEIAGPRWALVGDAAALADPVTGEGISFAVASGVMAAEVVARCGLDERRIRGAYHDALSRAILPELRVGRGLAHLLYDHPRLRTLLFRRAGQALVEGITDVFMGVRTYRASLAALLRRLALLPVTRS